MGEEAVDPLEHDPWDERDAYLAEGHDEDEVEFETVVEAGDPGEIDLSEHTDE